MMNDIDISGWQEFQMQRLFKIKTPASRTIKKYTEGETPYVSSSGLNNGVVSYLSPQKDEVLEKGNCITVSPLEGTPAFYQKNDFLGRGGAGSAISLLYNDNLNENNALFICTVIKASAKKFDYSDAFNSDNLRLLKIKLPIQYDAEGNPIIDKEFCYSQEGYVPDWTFMSEYIKNIEKRARERIEKLASVKGNQTKVDMSGWKRFNLYDERLFIIDSGNKFDKSKMQIIEPSVNFVGRSSVNSGISCIVDRIFDVAPYKEGNMTIALGGEYLGSCFVQDAPFYTSQNVNVLIPRWEMPYNVKLFISFVIFKESRTYYKAFEDELNRHMSTDFSIMLPVDKDDNPDWKYMEQYIEAIQQKSQNKIDTLKRIV